MLLPSSASNTTPAPTTSNDATSSNRTIDSNIGEGATISSDHVALSSLLTTSILNTNVSSNRITALAAAYIASNAIINADTDDESDSSNDMSTDSSSDSGDSSSSANSSDSSESDDNDDMSCSDSDDNDENDHNHGNEKVEDDVLPRTTTSNANIPFLPSHHLSSSTSHLPFIVWSCDGGEFSSKYQVKNILVNDTAVYCSNKVSNVNIVLKYQPNEYCSDAMFVLKSFIIKSPGSGYTAPCKEGIIFVSNNPIDPKDTEFFNDFTRSRFTQWIAKRSLSSSCSVDKPAIEPVAFFQLNECTNYITTHQLYQPTVGRFILLKLIRPSSPNPNRSPFNIDLQYAGFRGYHGKRATSFGNLN